MGPSPTYDEPGGAFARIAVERHPQLERNRSDQGDATARNFRYQYAYAVILLAAARRGDLPFEAIWCEHHDDILAERSDGRFEAYQIKTRRPERGAWKLSHPRFVQTIRRFIELREAFGERIARFHFVTNTDYQRQSSATGSGVKALTSPISFWEALANAAGPEDLPPVYCAALERLAKECGASSQLTFDVVRSTELVAGPSREDFDAVVSHDHLSPLADFEGLSASEIDRRRDGLVARIHRASSLQVSEPVRHIQPLAETGADTAVRAKRVGVREAFEALSERRSEPDTYPAWGRTDAPPSFGTLLDWHLGEGTRSGGKQSKAWTDKEFGREAGGFSGSTVRRWRTGKAAPRALGGIERALFGNIASFEAWRRDLRAAYALARGRGPVTVSQPPTWFLGRDDLVRRLVDKIVSGVDPVAVLVQGSPGIGKTSVCQAVANSKDVVARFGPRRWFAALEAADSVEALWRSIGAAAGCDPPSDVNGALRHLGDFPSLLVLDNLDTPWEQTSSRRDVEGALSRLVAVPGLVLLASFRGRDVVGEVPWAAVEELTELDGPQSTELFCSIAGERHRTDRHLPDFVSALGGVPLAIELVARRAASRSSLAPLWAQWRRIGTELASHPDFQAHRLTSLDASIELSLRSARLTAAARRLFALLGRLPAGLSADDEAALLGAGAFDAAESLLRVGLAIERTERITLLPPIREYSARHFAGAQVPGWVDHFLKLAKRGEGVNGPRGAGIRARLVPEAANIEAAVKSALEAGEREKIMPALLGIGRLTHMADLPMPAIEDLRLACNAAGDVAGEALCLEISGIYALEAYRFEDAMSAFNEARRLAEAAGDMRGAGRAIERIGDVHLRRSDLELAKSSYEMALNFFTLTQRLRGIGNCTKKLGDVAFKQSNYAAAASAYLDAMPRFRAVGDGLGEANSVLSLGRVELQSLNLDSAISRFHEAIPLFRTIGEVLGEVTCLKNIADALFEQGKLEEAEAAYREAQPLFVQFGGQLGPINCIMSLAKIALRRGVYSEAETGFREALILYTRISNIRGQADCHWGLAAVAEGLQSGSDALAEYDIALPLYEKAGYVRGVRECEEAIARLRGG